MKTLTFAIALLVCCSAAARDRGWENGSVWSVSHVETLPGKFDDYIANLKGAWKKFNDADEMILSYHVLQVPSTRDGEPDLILLVEYKNWAAFDRGVDYFDKLATKIFGSTENATTANIEREEIRKLRGGLTAQEVVFK